MKKTIRLTESGLHKVIESSVRRILSENNGAPRRFTTNELISDYRENFERAYNHVKEAYKEIGSLFHPRDFEFMSGDDVQFCIPGAIEAIRDAAGRLGSVITAMDEYNEGTFNEPEDWHERNEHGDFDTN